jgi:DNA-binding NarL/FixJ family response regulator
MNSTAVATTDIGVRPVRVAIIDRCDVVHAGVEAWCADAAPPIAIVDSFHTPEEYFARYALRDHEIDVVLFDLQTDSDGPDWDTLAMLCDAGPRVIVHSRPFTDEVILTALDMGVVTYVAKSDGKHPLIDAIHAARSGQPCAGPRMVKALNNYRASGRTKLSLREKGVLIAWFQTESKEVVGKRLYIAPTTVRTHLQRVRAKYAAAGRPAPTKSALLARAVEDGILSLGDL